MKYTRILRRHMALLLLVPLFSAALTYFGSRQLEPKYEATATVVVLNRAETLPQDPAPDGDAEVDTPPVPEPVLGQLLVDERLINTLIELVKRRPVMELAIAELGSGNAGELIGQVSVTSPPQSQVIRIGVVDSEPEAAAAIANAVARAFVNLSEAEFATAGAFALVEPASEPAVPVSPNAVVNTAVAFLVAVAGAIALALILERLNHPVLDAEDIDEAVQLPTLAMVPGSIRRSITGAWSSRTQSAWADAFRRLRGTLTSVGVGSTYRSLLVTSETPAVGKSAVAANLAVAYALAGFKVLLVDLNLQHPVQHELFGLSNDRGMADYLLSNGKSPLSPYPTSFPNLFVLPAGEPEQNPDDLLARGLPASFSRMGLEYASLMIVDGPALSTSSDAVSLAEYADSLVVVAASRRTTVNDLLRALGRLEAHEDKILGVVLNRVSRSRSANLVPQRRPKAAPPISGPWLGSGEVITERISESSVPSRLKARHRDDNGSSSPTKGSRQSAESANEEQGLR